MNKEEIEEKLNKLSDEILKLKKELKKPEEIPVIYFHYGRKYSFSYKDCLNKSIYLAARVDYNLYTLIDLKNGNRFVAPVSLEEFNSKNMKSCADYIIEEID